MPSQILSTRNILQALRLHQQVRLSNRRIGQALGITYTTVSDYLRRAEVAGLTYAQCLEIGHDAPERRLFSAQTHSAAKRPTPDWTYIHRELGREHVTLDTLWREHKQLHPDGLQYSTFCEHYRKCAKKLHVSMRQHHAPADKLFVDYAGATIDVVDGATREVRKAQVFVAVLGASNYTFVEATWTPPLPTGWARMCGP